ncbi:unnamed protein product, partial [Prorocentrum cordatum]
VHAVRLPQLQLQDPMHAVRSSDASWGDGRHARAAGGPEFGHGDMRQPGAMIRGVGEDGLREGLALSGESSDGLAGGQGRDVAGEWVSSAHLPSSTSHEPRTMRRSWHVI